MTKPRELLLASASPRRGELLRQIGVAFRIVSHDVLEIREDAESARDFVMRMAREKAASALTRISADRRVVVLAADTVVVLGDEVLGKPRDKSDAMRMFAALSGQRHQVYTAVAVGDGNDMELSVSVSEVEFRKIDQLERDWYWDTGEPADKAGAYAIQGLGAVFVRHMSGSYSGVVGLPLCETALLLKKFGIESGNIEAPANEAQQ